jgi:ATP-dependent RNA helicase RhlB
MLKRIWSRIRRIGGKGPEKEKTPAAHPDKSATPHHHERVKHPPRAEKIYVEPPPMPGRARFHDLSLPPEIMRAIEDLEFQYCTPIQARTLPLSLKGQDVAGKAQTGTGKTAAFLITILDYIARHPSGSGKPGTPRALIMAPTRELCLQISKDAHDLGKYCRATTLAVYGGMDYRKQEDALRRRVDIIAATPGRLLDFAGQNYVDISKVEILVIDEADRMLDMGFIPDIRRIVRRLSPRNSRQTMLFSATLTQDVMNLARQWMRDPVTVEVEPEKVTVDTVDQVVYIVSTAEKFKLLFNLLKDPIIKRMLVFGNRRDRTSELWKMLSSVGISCELLTGEVDQKKRLRVLEDFRSGKVRVLVATDVAGRGLHVDDITHVVNYELPYEAEDYVHRIGRTARAGSAGIAISFACEEESFILPDIEKFIGRTLSCKMPEAHLLADVPGFKGQHRPRQHARPQGRRPGGRGFRRR